NKQSLLIHKSFELAKVELFYRKDIYLYIYARAIAQFQATGNKLTFPGMDFKNQAGNKLTS
ncbi:MAG: hypothetical protein ACI3X9_08715, partial [Bacteroidaceae bacterium]